jgi:hypothetical protein
MADITLRTEARGIFKSEKTSDIVSGRKPRINALENQFGDEKFQQGRLRTRWRKGDASTSQAVAASIIF